ncbi:MAG TPA: nitroreductase family deazaflavin-dependent oxidoreductase [Alphaproteobacteria bacterium]|nr:nitroreductase family deazaflavin-dependent oxidoreductase [Alphaproteobacteria bacterium]
MAQRDWVQKHIDRYRATHGEDGHLWGGPDGSLSVPCLLLTTTGRKSGEPQTTALIYGRDGDDPVVIASTGGRPDHPLWYYNLTAVPEVQVQIKADVFSAVAKTVNGPDRDRLWRMMAEIYPPYDEYEERARPHREIPVVALRRR